MILIMACLFRLVFFHTRRPWAWTVSGLSTRCRSGLSVAQNHGDLCLTELLKTGIYGGSNGDVMVDLMGFYGGFLGIYGGSNGISWDPLVKRL